jgi:hypothetical protein
MVETLEQKQQTQVQEKNIQPVAGQQSKEKKQIIVIIAFEKKYLHLIHHVHGEEKTKELTFISQSTNTNISSVAEAKQVLLAKTGVTIMHLPNVESLGNFSHEDDRSEVEAHVYICTQWFKADVLDGIAAPYKTVMNCIENNEDFLSVDKETLTPLTKAILKNYAPAIQMAYLKASSKQ